MHASSSTPQPEPTLAASHGAPVVSFEFFPPKTAAMAESLWQSVLQLAPLGPRFVSVTYGADGSTRDHTHALVSRLRHQTNLCVAPHLTCVGAPRAEVLDIARRYWDEGVRHIVALRGDPPAGSAAYVPHPDGFHYAVDLVGGLRGMGDFDITVAAYPEVHPEAPSAAADLDYLKAKIDAGASRAVTQFCFDTGIWLRFRDACARAGITVPIVPGILPITRFTQVQRFAARCGATMPAALARRFEGLDNDPETHRLIAAAVAIEEVQTLQRHGVREFHFYTLNRADLSYAVCHALGLRAAAAA